MENMSDLPLKWRQKIDSNGKGQEMWAALELRVLNSTTKRTTTSGTTTVTSTHNNQPVQDNVIPTTANEQTPAVAIIPSSTSTTTSSSTSSSSSSSSSTSATIGKKRKDSPIKSKKKKKKRKKSTKTKEPTFTRENERTIVLTLREHGENMATWSKLAALFPSQSITALQNHFQKIMKRARKAAKRKK